MAINFNDVKNLSIPEGKVLKIEDEYGQVLWCPSTFTETFTSSRALMSWSSRGANATMSHGTSYIGDWDGNGNLIINFSKTNQWATTSIYGSYYNPPGGLYGDYPSAIAATSTYWSSYTDLTSPIIVSGSRLDSTFSDKQYLLVLGSSNTGTGSSYGMKYCAITATYAPSVSLWSLNFEAGNIGSTYRASYGSVKLGYSTIDAEIPNPFYPPQ